jgi:hypothetical protein
MMLIKTVLRHEINIKRLVIFSVYYNLRMKIYSTVERVEFRQYDQPVTFHLKYGYILDT